jgi:hypothetical protein
LILGQSLWYAFYPGVVSTDKKFMEQMDALIREVGDRGKTNKNVSRGDETLANVAAPAVAFEPTPAPAPAPATPATPDRAALASATSEAHHFSPSILQQMPMSPAQQHGMTMSGGSLTEIAAIFKEQRDEAKTERDEAKAERLQMDARLAEMQAKLEPRRAISEEQLTALQSRVEKLLAEKLLSDDEAFVVEDLCADYIELESSVGKLTIEMAQTNHAIARACRLVALSDRMASDNAFARQIKRKFV